VLVLDDGGERLLADEEVLAALGYEPVGFTRVDDALAACRAAPKRFDAAVLGHLSSVASAFDLGVALRAIVPNMADPARDSLGRRKRRGGLGGRRHCRYCPPASDICRTRASLSALSENFRSFACELRS